MRVQKTGEGKGRGGGRGGARWRGAVGQRETETAGHRLRRPGSSEPAAAPWQECTRSH